MVSKYGTGIRHLPFVLKPNFFELKMDRLTVTQRIKITKTYYKNGDSATATYRALGGDYGLHNRPTTLLQLAKL